MANFKEGLLITLQEKNYKIFSPKEIAKNLRMFTVFEKQQLDKALAELTADGELLKVEGGKFKVLNKQSLIKGVIKGNRRGFAFLIREDKGKDLFIPNKSLNGAFNKDTVYAQIVAGDEGEVVSIIERNRENIVGTMSRNGRNGFIIADEDSYFTDLFVLDADVENNTKVVAKIVGYEDNRNPTAKVVEVLGMRGEITTEVMAILRNYNFSDAFPESVTKESEKLTEITDIGSRVDFTNIQTITIDGDDAKDFDDAISIVKLADGYRLYVHIADVASYVRINSAIDLEAKKRGTSVYFPGNVFPMLPEKLCNNLCSLRPNEKKPVLTCIMDISNQGKVTSYKVEEGVIESAERMTYHNVTKILNGDAELIERYKNIYPALLDMRELANILSKKRQARGSINFISKEMKVILNDKNEIVSLEKYPYEESNAIIEEFMLVANETVAEFVYRASYPFVYRVHEEPLEEKLIDLGDFLRGCGINIKDKAVDPSTFGEILEQVKGETTEGLVNKVMLRSMCKAKYDNVHGIHFGLAAEFYCHFTSPIRRYPDLTIHRIIKDIILGKITDKKVEMYGVLTEEVAKSSTERERAAEMSERDIDDYYKAMFMQKHVGDTFDGIISGVTSFGIFVELANTVEGLINIDSLHGDGYVFDSKQYTLSNKITTYRLGDKMQIIVDSADIIARKIRFVPYSDNAEQVAESRKNAKNPPPKGKRGVRKPQTRTFDKKKEGYAGGDKSADRSKTDRTSTSGASGEKRTDRNVIKQNGDANIDKKFSDRNTTKADGTSGERNKSDKPYVAGAGQGKKKSGFGYPKSGQGFPKGKGGANGKKSFGKSTKSSGKKSFK